MVNALLVLNAGSSSLKFTLYTLKTKPVPVYDGNIDGLYTEPKCVVKDRDKNVLDLPSVECSDSLGHQAAIKHLMRLLGSKPFRAYTLKAVGHRIVHGGSEFAGPVLIDAKVLAKLDKLIPLAPLHQPHNVAAIEAIRSASPELPQVACFDTAFHQTMPEVAHRFAIPREFSEQGVRRYGFHGLSYEYVASELRRIDQSAVKGRTIVAHIGNGVSLCAMRAGRSVATTMGLTPLDGVPMGTRSGAVDPGVLLYLMDHHGLDSPALSRMLYHESGLLGVSGISSDMRMLLASPSRHAKEAVALFVYRIRREIGSLAAALSGLDTLVFTGGIGENAPSIRQDICKELDWLGIKLSNSDNQSSGPIISAPNSRVRVWVIPTDEEWVVANQTLDVLGTATTMEGGTSSPPFY